MADNTLDASLMGVESPKLGTGRGLDINLTPTIPETPNRIKALQDDLNPRGVTPIPAEFKKPQVTIPLKSIFPFSSK